MLVPTGLAAYGRSIGPGDPQFVFPNELADTSSTEPLRNKEIVPQEEISSSLLQGLINLVSNLWDNFVAWISSMSISLKQPESAPGHLFCPSFLRNSKATQNGKFEEAEKFNQYFSNELSPLASRRGLAEKELELYKLVNQSECDDRVKAQFNEQLIRGDEKITSPIGLDFDEAKEFGNVQAERLSYLYNAHNEVVEFPATSQFKGIFLSREETTRVSIKGKNLLNAPEVKMGEKRGEDLFPQTLTQELTKWAGFQDTNIPTLGNSNLLSVAQYYLTTGFRTPFTDAEYSSMNEKGIFQYKVPGFDHVDFSHNLTGSRLKSLVHKITCTSEICFFDNQNFYGPDGADEFKNNGNKYQVNQEIWVLKDGNIMARRTITPVVKEKKAGA